MVLREGEELQKRTMGSNVENIRISNYFYYHFMLEILGYLNVRTLGA